MKTKLAIVIMFMFFHNIYSQNYLTNQCEIRTLDGSSITVNKIFNDTIGTIVIFWKMNDPQSNRNLDNLNEIWQEKIKHYGINLISICIDKTGTWHSVKPFIASKEWESENYIDFNGKLIRTLSISNIPYTILLDGNNEIKYRYSGYCIGIEQELSDKIINCIKKGKTLANFK